MRKIKSWFVVLWSKIDFWFFTLLKFIKSGFDVEYLKEAYRDRRLLERVIEAGAKYGPFRNNAHAMLVLRREVPELFHQNLPGE